MRLSISPLRILLLGCLTALLFVSGCARPANYDDRNRYGASDTSRQPAPTTAADTYGQPVPGGSDAWNTTMNPRYYRRDSQGNVYYTDRQGGSHVIERRERGMNVTDGDRYYLRDSSTPYYADPEGRLYSTSPGGRIYLEDNRRPGEMIDPMSVRSGNYNNPVYGTVPSSAYCMETWQRCSFRCDELSRPGARSACMEDCAIERDRCERR